MAAIDFNFGGGALKLSRSLLNSEEEAEESTAFFVLCLVLFEFFLISIAVAGFDFFDLADVEVFHF